MGLSKVQKNLNKASRTLGDINAIKKGTIHKRVKNRVIGKKPLKKLFG
nr:hypothetical protein [Fredinandcohnia onubensis]